MVSVELQFVQPVSNGAVQAVEIAVQPCVHAVVDPWPSPTGEALTDLIDGAAEAVIEATAKIERQKANRYLMTHVIAQFCLGVFSRIFGASDRTRTGVNGVEAHGPSRWTTPAQNFWSAWEASNLQPLAYQANALAI